MNVETKWLIDFLSLVQTKNFSRSAKDRHLTQPAFSRRIQSLEMAVGCELIDRSTVPVQLTNAGHLFQLTARNLLAQLEESVAHIQVLKPQSPAVIDFAVSHTLSLSLFPDFLHSLRHELTGIQCRQLVANVDDSVQALKNGICDFLLAFEEPSLASANFKCLDLQTESLIPVCRADEKGRAMYHLDEMATQSQPCLLYPSDIYLGRLVNQLLCQPPHAVELEHVFESPMADSLKLMAMQGMGIAWVPGFAIANEIKQGFLVPCGGELWHRPLPVCLYRCSQSLSPLAETLWQVLEGRYGQD